MSTHNFQSSSLQDTKKEIEEGIQKKSLQESHYQSDFAEASPGSSDSTLRDIKNEIEEEFDFEYFSESELSSEKEIKEELEKVIKEELEEETEEELEEEIEEKIEKEIEEEIDKMIEKEIEEETEGELEEETEGELEEETEGELDEETEDEHEEETEEELDEETEDEHEEETEDELEEEIEEEHDIDIEEIEEEIEREIQEDIKKETLHEFDYPSDIDDASLSLSDLSLLYITNEIKEEIDFDEPLLSSSDSTLRDIMNEFEEALDFDEGSLNLTDRSLLDITNEIEKEIDSDEFSESELSREIYLKKDLLKERGARIALEVNVSSVRRDRARMGEDLKKERKEKEALPKPLSLKQEQAQISGLQATIEHMRAEIADNRSGEDHRHHEDHQLASENKTLRSRLEDALHETELARKQHQEDRDACSRLEEQVKKEKARFLRVNKKFERLKKAAADIEALLYDKETLNLQNNDITGKLEAMEAKCKETVSQKDDIIFKNRATIVELRHTVDELTAHRSNSESKRAQIEDALNQQQKDADKLDNLTHENQQLASENMRLQEDLKDALSEMQLARDATFSKQREDREKLDFLTRENQQVASVNNKLRSELDDAVRERQNAHVAGLSKQRKLDDLTEKNHQLASKNKRAQGELEDALNDISLARDAAILEQQEYLAQLDSVKRENQQVAFENKRLEGELEDAQTEIHVAREAAMSQQQEYRAKLDNVKRENQQVASENKRLQGELEDAVRQHQEDREACRRLEEQVKKEKARFLRVHKKFRRLNKAPADIAALMYNNETLSLQSNDVTGKLEAVEAKCKVTVSQKDDIIFENQAIVELRHTVDELTAYRSTSESKKANIEDSLNQKDADKLDNLTHENQQLASENRRLQGELEEQAKKEKARFLRAYKKLQRLKRGPADTEELMYDKETRRMENKYITGKLENMEAKYDLIVQRYRAHSRRNQQVLAQKDDAILKYQAVNAKLQHIVDELRAQQSESKMKQAQLEDTLHQEQIQRAILEERRSNTASILEKQKKKTVHFAYALKIERATTKRYSFELTEAKINQVKLQERQHLSPSLHNL